MLDSDEDAENNGQKGLKIQRKGLTKRMVPSETTDSSEAVVINSNNVNSKQNIFQRNEAAATVTAIPAVRTIDTANYSSSNNSRDDLRFNKSIIHS